MERIRVHNWDKWQSYRKDRGTPPWIKIHRNVLSSPKWAVLSDAEKGQLLSMWIVAADNDGTLPSDARLLKKICQLDQEPNIEKFQEDGWLEKHGCQDDANVASRGRHSDAPETEERRDRRETEGEKREPSAKIGKYAFEGIVVRITHDQQTKWQGTFSSINVIEHLKGIDRSYIAEKEQGGDTSYWFPRCAQALANANRKALAQKGGYDV